MKIDHNKDKEYLLGLVEALKISKRNLRKDELGYWNLFGRRAKIDTDSEHWYVRIECKSKRRWWNVKDTLSFMGLWQNGDDEGALRLGRYPSEEEAQKIRKICGFSVVSEKVRLNRNFLCDIFEV